MTLAAVPRVSAKDPYEIGEKYNRHADLPVVGIDWYMAAKYCNLLSKEEGIDKEQRCYETNAKGNVTKLKDNYLSLSGYRLPTEAEMEYATRAKAVSSRYYGETEELLGHYAWYTKNSNELMQQVGTKKPNDFGLFDTQGNCLTWCQEYYDVYPEVTRDESVKDNEVQKDKLTIRSTTSRVLRGGSFRGSLRRTSVLRTATTTGRRAAPASFSVFVLRGLLILSYFTALLLISSPFGFGFGFNPPR